MSLSDDALRGDGQSETFDRQRSKEQRIPQARAQKVIAVLKQRPHVTQDGRLRQTLKQEGGLDGDERRGRRCGRKRRGLAQPKLGRAAPPSETRARHERQHELLEQPDARER